MATSLFYDAERKKRRIARGYNKHRSGFSWTHFSSKEEDSLDKLMEELGRDAEFKADLIEEQRPRFNIFKDVYVLILGIPSSKTITSEKDDYDMEQLAIVIKRDRIVSISRKKMPLIRKVMFKLSKKKRRLSSSYVLSMVLEEITENIIKTIESYEDIIESVENSIMKGKVERDVLLKVNSMKENAFHISKVLKANYQSIVRLENALKKWGGYEFNVNIKDRVLYALDNVETIRESLRGITNLYIGIMSHRMNENVYKLTIIGTAFLIPMLIAAFYGMNVPLPKLTFWQLVFISFTTASLILAIMKVKKWI